MVKYNITPFASALLALIGLTSCSHSVTESSFEDLLINISTNDFVQWESATNNPLLSYSVIDWERIEHTLENNDNTWDLLQSEYAIELGAFIAGLKIPSVIGPINTKFKTQFIEATKTSNRIAIMSFGGDSRTAIELSEYIYEIGNIELIVFGICSSNCAELLLPAASSVVLFDSPFLGVHGNLISMEHFAKNGASDPCPNPLSQKNLQNDLKSLSDRMSRIYQKTGHHVNFWESQVRMLGQPKFTFYIDRDDVCSIGQKFDNEFWYPTTKQFSELMGLKFEGFLCSDNQECYQKRIGLFEDKGSKLIIDSKEFIVE